MSSTTPNLALTLYDSTTDQVVTFATFRAVWGGPASTSNFYKIDTAWGLLDGRIDVLEAYRGAIPVPSSFISANYYEATVSGITAYATGLSIILSVDTTSSGTVTLNINSLGVKSVMKSDSTGAFINLTGSDLVVGRRYLFTYDGTRWLWVSANSADQIQIVGTTGNVVTVGSTNNLDGTLTQSLLVSQTIHAATAKTTLADADEFGIVDSAASNILKLITWANIKTAIGTGLGAILNAVTAKTTPVDADIIGIGDSAASFATKKSTISQIFSILGSLIVGYTAKTTPVGADGIVVADSASSNANKYVLLSNLHKAIGSGTQSATTYLNGSGAYDTPTGVLPQGYLFGLTISNNGTDPTNDIDIDAGKARDITDASDMILASALTKRLDAAWAVGTNQGGLDTGSIANGTYHVWLIKRPDTGVVDVLFSASSTSPTMPTDYTIKRRIASFMRESAAIVPFVQDGDIFYRNVPINSVSVTNPGTAAVTRTLHVPTGIRVNAIISVRATSNGVSADYPRAILITDLATTDTAPTATVLTQYFISGAAATGSVATVMSVWTNTSAQVRSRVQISTASTGLDITTLGWSDPRSRGSL